jgi:hypothetical protein
MKYGLWSLMIVMLVAPPLLAAGWFVATGPVKETIAVVQYAVCLTGLVVACITCLLAIAGKHILWRNNGSP